MLKRILVGVATVLLGAALVATAANAAGPLQPAQVADAQIKVKNLSAVSFAGDVTKSGPTGPVGVPECAAVNCDRITMKVDLPHWAWIIDGGVQVTISWAGLFNDIAYLAVYKNGTRVGLSAADVTSFQSIRLNTAQMPDRTPNGTYDIYVAYAGYPQVDERDGTTVLQDSSEVITYDGWAQVQYNTPNVPRGRDLLPNLKPLMPTTATFNTPVPIFGDVPSSVYPSCFQSEVEEQGATLCMRIDQKMWNVNGYNSGPVEIRFNKTPDEFPAVIPVMQRIYRSDGTFYDRPAGTVDLHPIHSHYHFSHYSQTSLVATNAAGNPVGTALRAGIKNGFCLADTDVVAKRNSIFVAPMAYTAPGCLMPRNTNADGTETFVEGEGPGNGDTYGWDLPDQYVPVAGLTDGVYVAQTVIDPDGKLLESSTADNCIAVRISLTGLATGTPTAQILGQAPACV